MLVTGVLTGAAGLFGGRSGIAARAAAVVALVFLVGRRVQEYHLGRLRAAPWDVAEAAALFVAVLPAGPVEGGVSLFYSGTFFRTVHGSRRRVMIGTVVYMAVVVVATPVSSQLTGLGRPSTALAVSNVFGLAVTTLLMRLMLGTVLVHQREVLRERRLLGAVLDSVNVAVIAYDTHGAPTLRNRAAVELYADLRLPEPPAPWHSSVEVLKGDGVSRLPPEDMPGVRALRGEHIRDMEIGIGLADGTQRFYLVNAQAIRVEDDPSGAVISMSDITARRQAERNLSYLALHDPLTGLANRALVHDRLEHALARRGDQPVSLLFIDLDRFKTVNDSLGHQAGDEVIVAAAARLRSCLRPADTIARLGGDEFAVLLEDRDAAYALEVAEAMLQALEEPLAVGGSWLVVGASIGVVSSATGSTAEELLRNADLAMYAAKRRGGHRAEQFEPGMHRLALRRLTLEADLRRALKSDELRVVYQPIVSLRTGRLSGVEALLRWEPPHGPPVPPSEFIPVAEATGLIVPIGEWVLWESCRQLRSWRERLTDSGSLFVAVNVAVGQLQDRRLVDTVRAAVTYHQIEPSTLVIEVTESAVGEHEQTLLSLAGLRELGVTLALDDFGTGYSSLSRLRHFPFHKVKIDRSFVQDIGKTDEAPLAVAIMAMARSLNLTTVAEGVEKLDQLEFLREHGCDEVQGFLIGRPGDPTAVERLWQPPAPAPPWSKLAPV